MDVKGAFARPRPNKVNTSLDADFQTALETALGTPVIFPANDSDSDDNSSSVLCLDDHHIGSFQHLWFQNKSSDQHLERLNTNVAVHEAKRGVVRRNTNGRSASPSR